MIIKYFWPKCSLINKKWTRQEIDSFWVECTLNEAEREIFPYLTKEEIEESKKNWRPSREDFKQADHYCFLVSKDLKSIESFPWYYPISGHWGAYSPFEAFGPIEIDELEKIKFLIKGMR